MMFMFSQKCPLNGQTRSVTANLFWSYENTLHMSSQNFSHSLFIILSPSSLFISSAIVFFTCDKGNIIRGKLTCGRTTMGDIWRHSEPEVNKQCRHRLRYCTITTGMWTVQRVFGVSWIIKEPCHFVVWLNFLINRPPFWLFLFFPQTSMTYHNNWKVIRRETESWKCENTEEGTDWNATAIDVTEQERTWGNVCFCTAPFHLEYVNDGLPQASADYFEVKLRAHYGYELYEIRWTKKGGNYIFENGFDSTFFSARAWRWPLFFAWGSAGTAGEDKNEAEDDNFTGYDLNNFSLQQLIWRWEWSRIWSKQC